MSDVFFERPYAIVRWDDEYSGVYLEMRGFAQGESFREVFDKALELLQARHASRWMIDLSELPVTSLTDQDWMAHDWIPRCFTAGLVHSAVIQPKSMLAQMGITRINKSLEPENANYPVFSSAPEARQWLLDTMNNPA